MLVHLGTAVPQDLKSTPLSGWYYMKFLSKTWNHIRSFLNISHRILCPTGSILNLAVPQWCPCMREGFWGWWFHSSMCNYLPLKCLNPGWALTLIRVPISLEEKYVSQIVDDWVLLREVHVFPPHYFTIVDSSCLSAFLIGTHMFSFTAHLSWNESIICQVLTPVYCRKAGMFCRWGSTK